MSGEPTVRAGRVARPHGLDGSFHVAEAVPMLLGKGGKVQIAGEIRTIERRAGTDSKPIVRLAGSTSRDDAEALRGSELRVARDSVPALEEGEWWTSDLIGCRVLDGEAEVGTVVEVLGLPSCEVLEVERPEGARLMIPFIDDAVRRVDPEEEVIDVDLAFLGEAK